MNHWRSVWETKAVGLFARAEKLTEHRNRLVHSLWYAADSDEGAVTYRATAKAGQGLKQGFTAVPVSDIEQLADEMTDLAGLLHGLGAEVYPDWVQRHFITKPPHSERSAKGEHR